MPRSEAMKKACLDEMISRHADSIPFEKQGSPFEPKSLQEIIDDIPDDWLTDEYAMRSFCERIRLARKGQLPTDAEMPPLQNRKMSQTEVAEQLGISVEAYSKKERAPRPIDPTDLMNLCLLYRILPYYLLGLTEDPLEMYIPQVAYGFGDRVEGENVYPGSVSLPMYMSSDQVWNRCQAVLYNLYKNPRLYDLLMQLAEMKLPVQQDVMRRFKGLPSLRDCPVEAQLRIIREEEFQMEWTCFFAFKSKEEQEKHSKHRAVLEHLGQRNFECLDFMTRVALSPPKTQDAVKLLLEETGLFE